MGTLASQADTDVWVQAPGSLAGISGRFGKTGTMGTLASQADADVWVQAPGSLGGTAGIPPRKNSETVYRQNPAIQCIFDVLKTL